MKYIILCGSNHDKINDVPRQLVTIKGERILDRTIRLLRENGINDISVTGTDNAFKSVDAKFQYYDSAGPWLNCFPPVEDPVCFIFGDVYFSPEAINSIVSIQTGSVEFFASAPPFHPRYIKPWAEPFAFKVKNVKYFFDCIAAARAGITEGIWQRDPIAWELWQIIKGTPINHIDYTNYYSINDYTCDIDTAADVAKLERVLT